MASLAPQVGLEPTTYGLTVHRSTNWTTEAYTRLFLGMDYWRSNKP